AAGLFPAPPRAAAARAAGRERFVALGGLRGVLRDVLGAGEGRAQRGAARRWEHALRQWRRCAARRDGGGRGPLGRGRHRLIWAGRDASAMPKAVMAREITIAVSTVAKGSGSVIPSGSPLPSKGGFPGSPAAMMNSRFTPLPTSTKPSTIRDRVRSSTR